MPAKLISFDDTETAFRYKSDKELRKANFIFTVVSHPFISKMATSAVKTGMSLGLPIDGLVRSTVFEHFCGGETMEKAGKCIQQLHAYQVNSILDYSAEGEKSEEGFDLATEETLRTFDQAVKSDSIPFCVFKMSGMAHVALLEKIQSGAALSVDEKAAFERVRNRVDRICQRSQQTGIPILIDAEETWIEDTIDGIVYEMMRKYNKTRALVFITYQMYRSDIPTVLRKACKDAEEGGYFLGVKMVRGAYMEKERERALEKGYPSPIQPDKAATDKAFNECLAFCVEHIDRISLVCGSHNEYSNQYLASLLEEKGIPHNDRRIWFSQLLGMSDNISFNLAKHGYNVAKYVPYGPVRLVMPYLLRRASENTSVAGQSGRELTMVRRELQRRNQSR